MTEPDAIAAANAAPVAVFAFRGATGAPMAVPVTPYVDGGRIVVTSTLAYIQKAELIRRDGRVAMLANGVHITGDAEVFADADGDVFAERYLDQELAKYPPARALVAIPDYRNVLSWYFGRAIITFAPNVVKAAPGTDRCTLVRIGEDGYPQISPVSAHEASALIHAEPGAAVPLGAANGSAQVLFHEESGAMSSLRKRILRGTIHDGTFSVASARGTLERDVTGEIANASVREIRAREIVKDWPTLPRLST